MKRHIPFIVLFSFIAIPTHTSGSLYEAVGVFWNNKKVQDTLLDEVGLVNQAPVLININVHNHRTIEDNSNQRAIIPSASNIHPIHSTPRTQTALFPVFLRELNGKLIS